MDKAKKILFTGGGTGGHVMPIISITRELKKLHPDFQLHYIGPQDKASIELLTKESFIIHAIVSGKIRRYFSLQNITDIIFNIPLSFIQSFFLLLFIRPVLVFSKGGTGSLPVTFWAHMLRIPLFIHESDVEAGLSNRISAKWAKKVFTSFSSTNGLDRVPLFTVGNPIRKEILQGDMASAMQQLHITSKKHVILITGGSQGAQALNEFILLALNNVLKDYEVIHIAGPGNYKKIRMQAKIILLDAELGKYYHVYEFLDEESLKLAYAVSNIIVSRAGSGSIFEIAALGKPSILVPLPGSAKNHQSKNAYEYQKSGSAIVIEQSNLTVSFFTEELFNISAQYERMEESALRFAKPDAAEQIAKEIIDYVK